MGGKGHFPTDFWDWVSRPWVPRKGKNIPLNHGLRQGRPGQEESKYFIASNQREEVNLALKWLETTLRHPGPCLEKGWSKTPEVLMVEHSFCLWEKVQPGAWCFHIPWHLPPTCYMLIDWTHHWPGTHRGREGPHEYSSLSRHAIQTVPLPSAFRCGQEGEQVARSTCGEQF